MLPVASTRTGAKSGAIIAALGAICGLRCGAVHPRIETELRAQLATVLQRAILDGYPRRVGCPGVELKHRRDRRGIHDSGCTDGLGQRSARRTGQRRIELHCGIDECQERVAVLHAAIACPTADYVDVDLAVRLLAAHTEQPHMGGGSVEAVVVHRHARREQLYLHLVDRIVVIGVRVARHLLVGEVV